MQRFENNVFDTALLFEGGAMRGSYSGGAVNALLEAEVYVDYVAGISAGATCLVNYLARLPQRSRRCFIDVTTDSAFGGWKTAIKGKGIFDTHHMYYDMTEPGAMLELDYERFVANPAAWRVGVYNAERGENVYFCADQVDTEQKLTHVCKASGSMPIATPVTYIAGEACMDGAIGPSGGIPLDVAQADGYEKFLVILTRPRDYVKENRLPDWTYRSLLARYPRAAQALVDRPANYNRTRAELERLEAEGKAYVFYPEHMGVANFEDDPAKLEENFAAGYEQMQRELPKVKEFLGL